MSYACPEASFQWSTSCKMSIVSIGLRGRTAAIRFCDKRVPEMLVLCIGEMLTAPSECLSMGGQVEWR